MTWVRLAVFAAITLCAATVAQVSELAGAWAGTWTKQGDALPVIVTIERGASGFSAHFDSDALQVAAMPFAAVEVKGEHVHLTLKGDDSTTEFDGTLNGDALTGTFTDGTVPGSFDLRRAAQTPPVVEARDIAFANGAVHLAGTLLMPAGSGKHPAIAFLHGSGPEGRWANRWLAQRFAAAGFVALITDKRGAGGSSGDWRNSGFDDLAGDGAAAVALLRSLPEADGAHIGIYGHSQGATLSPLVAIRDPKLAFIIASAPGGLKPSEVEFYSVGNAIGLAALPVAERKDAAAYLHEVIAVAYDGKPRTDLSAMAVQFKDRSWFFPPPPPDNSYWAISHRIAGFDPDTAWTQVMAPVLLVYGKHDERVPRAGLAAIQHALRRGGNHAVTLRHYPDADHTFTLVEPGKKGGWPHHVPDYAQTLIDWARLSVR